MFPFTFFHCRSLSPCVGGRSHFSFCHRCYKIFLLFFQQKKNLPCFWTPALNPCRPFSRWASLACCPLSLFLCLSLALYSKFVDMTTPIQKQFPLSVFVFIDSFVLLYKMPVAMRFPAKITLSCIWVTIPVDWVILHWYACGADGQSLGWAGVVWSRDYQIFSDG